jgi:hypothetical protein
MAIPYVDPGIQVAETTNSAVTAELAGVENIALVGLSQGYIEVTDILTFDDGPGGHVAAPASPAAVLHNTGGVLGSSSGTVEYFYVVTAVNAAGETIASSEVNATTVSDNDTSSVTISWTASVGAVSYRVYRGTVTDSENVYFTAYGTTFLDTGIPHGTLATPPVSNTAALPGTGVEVDLPTLAANPGASLVSVVEVFDATNPNFTASNPYQEGAEEDYTVSSDNLGIQRTSSSRIPQTGTVFVTYQYTTAGYFDAALYTNLSDVENQYGPATNALGTGVETPVSFAALLAFGAGAQQIFIAPLFTLADPADPDSTKGQPSTTDANTASTAWEQTLTALQDQVNVDLIVPVIGQSANLNNLGMLAILEAVEDFLNIQQNNDVWIQAIAGEDGSQEAAGSPSYPDKATMRVHAATLQSRYANAMSQSMVLVNSTTFNYAFPVSNVVGQIGGQYVAAAIAGLLNSGSISDTINLDTIPGILGIADVPKRTKADLQADAQAGMLVVTQPINTQSVQIRHAITLDNSTYARRELSVVRSKFFMITSMIETLQGQIIGKTVPPGQDPGTYVESAVIAVLEALQGAGDIASYDSVAAIVVSNNPTTVAVSFNFTPNFPIDYIQLSFAVNMAAGTANTSTVTAG